MPSPLAAVVLTFAADGDEVPLGLDSVVGEFAQAFNKILVPKVAEPYSKNFRRLKCFAIGGRMIDIVQIYA